MENVIDKERRCIEMSCQARLAAAKARLAELEKNGIPFDGPGINLAGEIEWEGSTGARIIQVAILPLVLVFAIVAFAVTPITYVLHLRKTHQKKKEFEKEIREIEAEPLSDQVPEDKDIESLWRLHGLDERKYSLDARLTLLDAWIDILYGEGVSENIRLRSRGGEIAERNLKANQPYYRGEDAPHFLFVSPDKTLAHQLSEELPEYE